MEEIKNINTEVMDTSIVNLEELEFNPIHKIINYKNNQGETKQITIFNLDENKEKKMLEILIKYSNVENKEVKFDIPQTSVFAEIFPLLTDIQMPSDEKSIERIINNPNTVLKEVLLEVTQQLTKIMEVNFKSMEIQKKSLEVAGIDENKMNELVEKTKEIKSLEVTLEKEKQLTAQEEAKTNEEELKKILQGLQAEKVKNLELMAKLEEDNIQPEKKRRGRPRKAKEVEE